MPKVSLSTYYCDTFFMIKHTDLTIILILGSKRNRGTNEDLVGGGDKDSTKSGENGKKPTKQAVKQASRTAGENSKSTKSVNAGAGADKDKGVFH